VVRGAGLREPSGTGQGAYSAFRPPPQTVSLILLGNGGWEEEAEAEGVRSQ
jgi:hypothetical protein